MYHVNEFALTPRNGHLMVVPAYTSDTLPSGRVVSRQGNAIRVEDPEQPDVQIIVSRPWSEGGIFPLPLESEDLSWAFNPAPLNIWSVFDEAPISGGVHQRWKEMRKTAHGREALDEAARHIVECDASPWVFSADWRHFLQFADDVDKGCFFSMSHDAIFALMGEEYIAVENALEEGVRP